MSKCLQRGRAERQEIGRKKKKRIQNGMPQSRRHQKKVLLEIELIRKTKEERCDTLHTEDTYNPSTWEAEA